MHQQKTAIATQIVKQRLLAKRAVKLAFELSPALKPAANQPVQPPKPPAAVQPPPAAAPKAPPAAPGPLQPPALGASSFLHRNQYALPAEAQSAQQQLLQKMYAGQQLNPQEQQQFQAIQKQEFDLAATHPGGYEAGRAAQTPRTAAESAQALAQYNAPYEAADAMQRGIDQTLADQKQQRQLASGDWWSTWGRLVGSESGGRAFGKNVWHPVSETLGQGAGLASMGLKMVGNQLGAGYMALDSGYNKLRANMASDPTTQNQFQNNATESWRTAQRLNQATEDTKGKLWRGETATQPHVEVVTGPGGQPTVRVITDPLSDARQEMVEGAGQEWANSGWGQTADVLHGVGNAAADAAPYVAAPAGILRGAKILRAVPGGVNAVRAATTANNVLNPALRLSPTLRTALTVGGATTGTALGARNVMHATTPEARVDAGRSLVENTLAGGFLGNMAGGPGANLVRRAVGAGEALPAAGAVSAAAPSAGAAPAAASSAPAAARAGNSALRTAGGIAGLGASLPAYAAPGIAQQGQAQAGELAQSVADGDQMTQLHQATGAAGTQVDATKIPPAFHADLARTVNIGENGVEYGTSAVNTPEALAEAAGVAQNEYDAAIAAGKSETEAAQIRDNVQRQYSVETSENADFLRWMQDSGAYRGPNGEPGAIEQQATAAGQAAFDETFKRTGREAEAEQARNTAYRDTFTGAYKSDQQTKYQDTLAEMQAGATDGADLDTMTAKAQQAWLHYSRANPGSVSEEEFNSQLDTALGQLQENRDVAAEAIKNPAAAAQITENSRAEFEQQQLEALTAENPMPTDPKDAGDWWANISTQVSSAWENMGQWGQLAFGLGVPLGLIGILGGGLGGLMVAALGFGVAGTTGAMAGMFGNDAQAGALSAFGNIAGGISALTGNDAGVVAPEPDVAAPAPEAQADAGQPVQNQSANTAPTQQPKTESGVKTQTAAQPQKPTYSPNAELGAVQQIADAWLLNLEETFVKNTPILQQIAAKSDTEIQQMFQQLPAKTQTDLITNLSRAQSVLAANEKHPNRAQLPVFNRMLELVKRTKKSSDLNAIGLFIAKDYFAREAVKRATHKWAIMPNK